MADRLFGLEVEHALAAFNADNQRIESGSALPRVWDLAKSILPHIRDDCAYSMFLCNGARFYLDCDKLEMATPEVTTPWEACRFVQAGARILNHLVTVLVANKRFHRAFISRCNVAYGKYPTTWACHESIMHQTDERRLARHLIPHLVSRVIYAGAGGFNNRHPGLEFMISPRVAHIKLTKSSDSTRDRGIYHTKNEPLCQGYSRLHILCGESLCSETSLWLKIATTVLVVALIEAGIDPAESFQLRHSLAAFKRFATDTTMTERVRTERGAALTAIEIQRCYLDQVQAHRGHPRMPTWTEPACARWHAILDRLERGPEAVATTLDWAIKWAMFRDFAHKRGISWDSLGFWNDKINRIYQATHSQESHHHVPRILPAILNKAGPMAHKVKPLSRQVEEQGQTADQLPDVLRLREALFELDTRFGQLDAEGIFTTLDRAGVLDHHVVGVDQIEQAMETPPQVGRARLRGQWIRRLHRQGTTRNHICSWSAIRDLPQERYLDLSDPYVTDAHWQPNNGGLDVPASPPTDRMGELF